MELGFDSARKTAWISNLDRRPRMKWAVGITLAPGRAYIETEIRLHNRTTKYRKELPWWLGWTRPY